MKRLRSALWAIGIFAPLAIPVTTSAQIGGLIRKAARQAIEKPAENASALPSSAFGPALTEQTMTAALHGLEAQQALLLRRDSVAARQDALSNARSKLTDGHDADQQAYNAAGDTWNSCMDDQFGKIDQERGVAMQAVTQKLMADPAKMQAFQQQVMAMQLKARQMIQQGDTAGAKALADDFTRKMLGAGSAESDSTRAIKTCGNAPAKPTWMVQADADWERETVLGDTIRILETAADSTGAHTAGMTVEQFGNARERIMYWYMGQKSGTMQQRFDDAELRLFKEHKAEIMKLDRVL